MIVIYVRIILIINVYKSNWFVVDYHGIDGIDLV